MPPSSSRHYLYAQRFTSFDVDVECVRLAVAVTQEENSTKSREQEDA